MKLDWFPCMPKFPKTDPGTLSHLKWSSFQQLITEEQCKRFLFEKKFRQTPIWHLSSIFRGQQEGKIALSSNNFLIRKDCKRRKLLPKKVAKLWKKVMRGMRSYLIGTVFLTADVINFKAQYKYEE